MKKQMTTTELLEATMLHALGMLEDDECAQYEAAFASASPQVQANVRAEAERMADLGDLLPGHEPSAELRDIVIAAVRAAMYEQANEQRIASEQGIAGRIHATAGARGEYVQPKLSRSPRVHRIWRATSIGLAAGVIAMIAVTVNVQQTYNQAGSNAFIANGYDSIGGKFFDDTIFSPSTQRVVLTSGGEESTLMGASVYSHPDWNTSRLMVKNLRPQSGDEPYRLVVLDSEGNIVREVTQFTSNGEVQSIDIQINLSTENRLAIYKGMLDEINAQPLLSSIDSEI